MRGIIIILKSAGEKIPGDINNFIMLLCQCDLFPPTWYYPRRLGQIQSQIPPNEWLLQLLHHSVFLGGSLTIQEWRDLVRSQPGTACMRHCFMFAINKVKSVSVSRGNRPKGTILSESAMMSEKNMKVYKGHSKNLSDKKK